MSKRTRDVEIDKALKSVVCSKKKRKRKQEQFQDKQTAFHQHFKFGQDGVESVAIRFELEAAERPPEQETSGQENPKSFVIVEYAEAVHAPSPGALFSERVSK